MLESAGECLIVDPAFFPRELDDLRAHVDERGRAVAVAFTHVHWDHVVGWQTFPEAEVVGSEALARAIAEDGDGEARRNLEKAGAFDREWYVERASPLCWPKAMRALGDGDEVKVGTTTVQALALPGHSADGVGLVIEEARVLIVGDHLSPCEIPFVDDLAAYRATLAKLMHTLAWIDDVIPGHGRRLTRDEALTIAKEDLAYLDALAQAVEKKSFAGANDMTLPRGDPAIMGPRHRENCVAVGLA